MNSLGRKYVLICPVRNEEKYIEKAILSAAQQTIQPVELLVIDDGSTDRTAEIVKSFMKEYSWLHYERRPDRGERKVGKGVVEAFYDGYKALWTENYDYIGKVDGDLSYGPKYFETLFNKFKGDPFLGAASGKLYLDLGDGKLIPERNSDEMVIGGMQFYRKQCFEGIGGFVPEIMWDGIAYHRCRMEGWRTRSYKDEELMIHDHRLMGSSQKTIFHGRLRWGWGQYFMGTHPIYILAVGVYRLLEKPYIIGGIMIVLGYVRGFLTGSVRYDFPGFRRSLRAWQWERLKLGRRLERIPMAPKAEMF